MRVLFLLFLLFIGANVFAYKEYSGPTLEGSAEFCKSFCQGGDAWTDVFQHCLKKEYEVDEDSQKLISITTSMCKYRNHCPNGSWGSGQCLSDSQTGMRPKDDLGAPGDSCKSQGCPDWAVNKKNLNLYVTDTPLWYDAPYGPDLSLDLSYNSQSSIAQNEIFGNKWTFNYGTYLVEDPGVTATIFMPDGKRSVFVYNSAGEFEAPYGETENLVKVSGSHYVLNAQNGTEYTYSSPSNTNSQQVFLTQVKGVDGFSLTLTYDSNARLISISDAQSRVTTFTYDANDLVSKVADPFGREANFTYDAQRNLVSIQDMGGYTSHIAYDSDVYITEIDKPNEGKWLFSIEPADGVNIGSIAYSAPGSPMWENYRVTITSPLGHKTEHYYNGLDGRSWTVKPNEYVDYQSQQHSNYTHASKTEYRFLRGPGGKSRFTSKTYPDGSSRSYKYDSHGNQTERSGQASAKTTVVYNANHQVTSRTEAVGTPVARTTTYEYLSNQLLLPTKTIYPSLSNGRHKEQLISYNSQNLPLTVTDREMDGSAVVSQRVTSYQYNSQGLVTQIDGPRTDVNDVTSITYHSCSLGTSYCGKVATVTNALGQVTEYKQYVLDGKVSLQENPNGLTIETTYDGLGRPLTVKEYDKLSPANFRETVYTYEGPKRKKSVSHADGSTFTYAYSGEGLLLSITDKSGYKIQYERDKNGNVISEKIVTAGGAVSKKSFSSFDKLDRLLSSGDAYNANQNFQYDNYGNLTQVTDEQSKVTQRYYDQLNRLTKQTNTENKHTLYTYDAFDNVIKVTDPLGRATHYEYNVFGEKVSQNSPDTGVSTYQYDVAGNLVSKTDARGIVVNYQWDALNRLLSTQYPDVQENITYSYDDAAQGGKGQLTGINDHSGGTQRHYNAFGELSQEVFTIGSVSFTVSYQYDAGQVTAMTYPDGSVVSNLFDTQGRVIDKDLQTSSGTTSLVSNVAYHPFGEESSWWYGNNLQLSRQFDLNHRLIEHSVTGINDVSLAYTNRGNISSVTDLLDAANDHNYSYDSEQRLSLAENQGVNTGYYYDALGNRLFKSEDGAIEERYQYVNGRLTSVNPEHSEILKGYEQAVNYRGRNGLKRDFYCWPTASFQEIWGTDIYTDTSPICSAAAHMGLINYSQGGSVALEVLPGQNSYIGTTRNGHTSREYGSWHGSFRLSPVTGQMPPAKVSVIEAGSSTRAISHRGHNGKVLYYACKPGTFTGNSWGTNTYSDTSAVCKAGGHAGVVSSTEGGVVKVVIQPGISSYPGGMQNGLYSNSWGSPTPGSYTVHSTGIGYANWSSTADSLGLQNGQEHSFYCPASGSLNNVKGSSIYTADSSICSAAVHAGVISTSSGGVVKIAMKAGRGQYYGTSSNGVNSATHGQHPASFVMKDHMSYDAIGNMVYKGSGPVLEYNQAGRLSESNNSGTSASYHYNYRGQRVKKTVNGVTRYFIYDKNGNVIAEANASGNVVRQYVYLNGRRLAQLENGSTYFIHTDHQDNSVALTDGSANVVWKGKRDPFGEVDVTTQTITHNLRLPGQYYDLESGLHYNYFRDYDPSLGRYIQSDPIGLSGGINTYGYVGQNPLRFVDPDGRIACGGVCVGIAVFTVYQGCRWLLVRGTLLLAGGYVIHEIIDEGETGECDNGQCPAAEDNDDWVSPIDDVGPDPLDYPDESDADRDPDKNNGRCDQMYKIDTATCKGISRVRGKKAGAACHASAAQRYGACLAGEPIPPLNTWNN
ncbi:RHS repeat-associated core domain-containing protein [Pseudoteredinibacter isoporae]|uniref:RHS repeat-associated protein n=1 Tax=Pseudoteredinibacter isoporae TaxID=570281 RepID=A0A7X0JW09_9GAMM|nr:LCCL domain-containing protein [Pseudoteredinibacter isoporae]MBB6522824.1 RHS repeat-associated protein [Pseudoteredinibacter isoporae]NHO88351.1 hypothetical protein [Pseudoteredinibacter isoporae]NIB23318.1 hypothetical protein [Pseudoteredinibacter isoporae]